VGRDDAVRPATRDVVTLEVLRRPLRASLGADMEPVVPWVTIALCAAIVVTGIATGAFLHEIPRSLGHRWSTGWPALRGGRWWTLASSFVLTRDWFMASSMPVVLGVTLGLYERRAGHTRALLVAVVGHAAGTVILSVAFAPLATTSVPMLVKAANNLDYGGSMVIAAACGALAARLDDRTFRRLVIAVTLIALPVHHQMADWGHFVAMPLGFGVDRMWRHRRSAPVPRLVSR
jgi:phosphatidylglycerol lysyltransferase